MAAVEAKQELNLKDIVKNNRARFAFYRAGYAF